MKKKIHDLIRAQQRAIQTEENKLDDILSEHDLGEFRSIFGYRLSRLWDCPTSPTGVCIYDTNKKYWHCRFCHQPAERK